MSTPTSIRAIRVPHINLLTLHTALHTWEHNKPKNTSILWWVWLLYGWLKYGLGRLDSTTSILHSQRQHCIAYRWRPIWKAFLKNNWLRGKSGWKQIAALYPYRWLKLVFHLGFHDCCFGSTKPTLSFTVTSWERDKLEETFNLHINLLRCMHLKSKFDILKVFLYYW